MIIGRDRSGMIDHCDLLISLKNLKYKEEEIKKKLLRKILNKNRQKKLINYTIEKIHQLNNSIKGKLNA